MRYFLADSQLNLLEELLWCKSQTPTFKFNTKLHSFVMNSVQTGLWQMSRGGVSTMPLCGSRTTLSRHKIKSLRYNLYLVCSNCVTNTYVNWTLDTLFGAGILEKLIVAQLIKLLQNSYLIWKSITMLKKKIPNPFFPVESSLCNQSLFLQNLF